MMTYTMDIAGLKRDLPLCPVSDDLYIGAFVMFGDVEMTIHAAKELLKRAPEFDYIIAPEAKAIPLAYEMSRQCGIPYLLARKKAKAYIPAFSRCMCTPSPPAARRPSLSTPRTPSA